MLGLFADTMLALAPDTGTVYSLCDGETHMVYTPIHRDVESLISALTHFVTLCQEFEESDDEDVEEGVDALRAEISEFDPLPFEDKESQWNLTLEEPSTASGSRLGALYFTLARESRATRESEPN